MPAGAFTGGMSFELDDTILDSGAGSQDFRDVVRPMEFKPQCIHVNRSNDSDQDDAGWCIIDGYLFGENEEFRKLWRVPVRQPVGYAFAVIYSAGTTARGIYMVNEV